LLFRLIDFIFSLHQLKGFFHLDDLRLLNLKLVVLLDTGIRLTLDNYSMVMLCLRDVGFQVLDSSTGCCELSLSFCPFNIKISGYLMCIAILFSQGGDLSLHGPSSISECIDLLFERRIGGGRRCEPFFERSNARFMSVFSADDFL